MSDPGQKHAPMKHVLAMATLYPNPVNPRFGTFVARSLEALAKRGDWRVTVLNPIGLPPLALGRYRPLADLPPVAVEGGITVHRPRFTLLPKVGGRRNPQAIARTVLPLVREIHARDPIDVIDAEFFYPDGPAVATIGEQMGIPVSIKARGSDINLWGAMDFGKKQILEAADKAAGLLAVSENLAGEMAALGIDRDKITIHYTGLDRDRFRPLDNVSLRPTLAKQLEFDLPADAPLFVSVGALIERKGQSLILEAMTQIPDSRLILVGKGEDEALLRSRCAELGLTDRVHFAGSLDHDVMPVILSAADIMVLPTASEGLANAWVEALACGTPCVTCNVGGAGELFTSPEAGRLVARDADRIAKGIKDLLADMPPAQLVSSAVSQFSWENNGATLAAHLDRLSNEN
jgi:glycosyltransferase involved in cell wall biosynthesis